MQDKRLDVYVSGSNSRFLSKDVVTEFRGRGDEIHLYPLSFSEYYAAVGGDKRDAWKNYYTYGGLPQERFTLFQLAHIDLRRVKEHALIFAG